MAGHPIFGAIAPAPAARYASDGEAIPSPRPVFNAQEIKPAERLTGLPAPELRKRLAATFPRIEAAKQFLARVDDARSKLSDQRRKAYRAVDRAEAALQKAREDGQPVSVTDAVLSGDDIGPGPVKLAKAKLAEAQAEADRIAQLHRRLDAEQSEGERQLKLAEGDRDRCVEELVAAHAEPLLAEYRELKQKLTDIELALRNGLTFGSLPSYWDNDAKPDRSRMEEWRSAIEKLKNDPNAPLPGGQPQQPATKRNRLAA